MQRPVITVPDFDSETVGLISSPKDKTSPNAEDTIDYETLLTIALEETSAENSRRSRRKLRLLAICVALPLMVVISIMGIELITDTTENEKLDEEVFELKNEIGESNDGEVLNNPQDDQNSTAILPTSIPTLVTITP